MSSIVDIINHYQTSINKSLNDTARIVHCIGKLYKLPISVRHLQDTGIGRTVNSLRKYDGEVGIAAKALVTKWKAMVASEESDDNTANVGAHGEGADSDGRQNDDPPYGEPQHRVDEEFREEPNRNDSNSEGDESDGQTAQPEVHYMMHHREVEPQHLISPEERAASSQWNEHHTSKRHSSGSSSRNHHHSSTSKSSSSSSSGHRHKTDGSDRKKSDGDHHHRHQSSSGGESKSHKTSSSSRSDHQGSSKKSSSHGDGDRHKDRSSSKHHSNNTNHHGAGSSSNSSSSHTRKDSSHKEGRHRSKEERNSSSKRHATEEIDTDRDAASSSKRSRKEQRTDHGGSADTAGQATSSSPNAASTPSSSSSSHAKKDKSSSSSSSKRRDHHDKSESSRERSESESKSKSKRKDKGRSSPGSNQEQTNDDSVGDDVNVEGLDCTGGASFADALAMIGMPSGSKKKASGSSKEKVKVTVVKSSPTSTSSNHRDGGQASYARSKRNGSVPSASDLLSQNVKLEPLPEASEIVESLPMISPNYRPMPLNQTVMECVFMGGQSGRGKGRPLTEEEALGQSMQSKNIRTKVYSGMKTNAKGVIPTLYELCIRLLQDHIDEIGATGGIPFYILKPVLERANPNQLLHLEHFNPHFVEESDVLWELHCKRTFRSKQRNEEELETWREMFLRCSEERDAKLRSLTQNIKLSQEQAAAPIRKTQLAYVDSAVKPPRSVISKQVKYGTARAPVVSPAARVAALKAGNVTQAGDARLRVAAGVRDNAQAQVFQPTKPRKAPMMAKVLSSMKGFKTSFRR
uniref:TFIIS N-terminal domain-containing protein n=1 Tax=Anopheles maculatus TaxID=74869 RepID=A0A182SB71_9DIPT